MSSQSDMKDKAEELGEVIKDLIPELVDNLTTDDSTKALTAKQGKVLKELIPSTPAETYIIELTPLLSSTPTYNINIDTQFTIKAKVTTGAGTAVSGYSVQLYKDGVSLGSSYAGTTDNNGEISFNYTCTTWGINDFSVANTHCQVNITGWKQISPTTTTDYEVYQKDTNIRIIVQYSTSQSLDTSWATLQSDIVPTANRPHEMVVVVGNDASYYLRINKYGVLQARTVSGTGSKTLYAQIDYTF